MNPNPNQGPISHSRSLTRLGAWVSVCSPCIAGGRFCLRFNYPSPLWDAHFSPRMQDVTMTLTHVDVTQGR